MKFISGFGTQPIKMVITMADRIGIIPNLVKPEQSVHVKFRMKMNRLSISIKAHLHKGLNLITWDYKLNEELALAAEEFKNKDKEQPLINH